jgi:Zn finger protein HypA/HybF involved in hydrogenase expression
MGYMSESGTIVDWKVKTKNVLFYCHNCELKYGTVVTLKPYCPLCHSRDYVEKIVEDIK